MTGLWRAAGRVSDHSETHTHTCTCTYPVSLILCECVTHCVTGRWFKHNKQQIRYSSFLGEKILYDKKNHLYVLVRLHWSDLTPWRLTASHFTSLPQNITLGPDRTLDSYGAEDANHTYTSTQASPKNNFLNSAVYHSVSVLIMS